MQSRVNFQIASIQAFLTVASDALANASGVLDDLTETLEAKAVTDTPPKAPSKKGYTKKMFRDHEHRRTVASQVNEMRKAGMTYRDIGKQLGWAGQTMGAVHKEFYDK